MTFTPNASLGRWAALAALVLAGCAAPGGGPSHGAHHAGLATDSAPPPSGPFYGQGGTAGGITASGGMRQDDKGAMCAMHRSMAEAPSEEARQAMMERHLQGMSAEQRRQHMERMRRHCQ